MTCFSLVYAGAAEVLPIVDFDLRRSAVRVAGSAKQLCIKKSVFLFLFSTFGSMLFNLS